MKSRSSETSLLWIIILTGASLRFWHYSDFSFINDELSSLNRTHFTSFSELIEKGIKTDVHPLFEQTFLFYWTKLAGYSVAAVRLPFILAGIACIPFIYLIGKRWFNSNVGLLAAALFAVLRYSIYYTQQARPYAFGTLFVLVSVYYWSRILFPTEEEEKMPATSLRNYFAGYILFTVFAWYTHYYTFLITGIVFVSGFFFVKRNLLKYYFLSGILIVLLYIPSIKILLVHLALGGLGGKQGYLGKPEGDFLLKHLLMAFNSSTIALCCAGLFLLLTILLKGKNSKVKKFHIISFLFFALPLLVGYAYSVLKNPVLQNSVPMFSFPYLLIFLGSFIPEKISRVHGISAVLLLLLCIYTTAKDDKYFKGSFKFIAEKTVEYDKQLGEHNYLKVINIIAPAYINYYLERLSHPTAYDMYRVTEPEHIAQLKIMLDTSHSQFFAYAYETCQNPHETEPLILSEFPIVVEENIFYDSGITLYKRSTDSAKQYLPMKEFMSRDGKSFSPENPKPIKAFPDSTLQSEEMNDEKEFSATFTSTVAELNMPDSSDCFLSAWIKTNDNVDKAKLVITFEHEGKSIDWVGADLSLYVKSPGVWQKAIIARKFPKNIKPGDTVKAYAWNPEKKKFFIHDLDLKVFTPTRRLNK